MDSFDKAWLEPEIIKSHFKDKLIFINQSSFNDPISLRIRKEAISLMNCCITEDVSIADIIITIETGTFKSNEAYSIKNINGKYYINGNTSIAVLYGLYSLIRLVIIGQSKIDFYSEPDQNLRMINQWDQVDGTVERGYSGASIFFGKSTQLKNIDNGSFSLTNIGEDIFRKDYDRITWYARLLSSIGINAISLNNVNVRGLATKLITQPYLDGVAEIAEIFTSFGIKTYLAINWESPKRIGGLKNSDPLSNDVQNFWNDIVTNIYKRIPDFGGFVVKADSEGEPGPYAYGRTHADGANMLAKPLKSYGGKVIWRTFVYNSKQDWRDRKTDRAKSAYENFAPLDGEFDDNVALQIKFGPIDFQTAEPLTPLFSKLQHTNQIIEFEITAEYLGQQIDINYALPQWIKMLNWDTIGQDNKKDLAKTIIKNNSLDDQVTGFAAVGNVGMDSNWTGNKLAQANLYGFGRMCWNNELNSDEILNEWIKQTFSKVNSKTTSIIFEIMSTSNSTFAKYNAPLGVGFMVIPHYHYGVSVNGYEYDRWGTYHFADRNGVGVDRTTATGTGFTSLYSEIIAKKLENYQTTPENLILFFHHLSYTTILASGHTVIQTIYNNHFDGYDLVNKYVQNWNSIENDIDHTTFENVSNRLTQQLENALEWKDQVNTYFYRMSGIPDDQGRLIYK